jgi:DUF1680 family protein
MPKFRNFALIVYFALICNTSEAQQIMLEWKWKYSLTDDPSYSLVNIKDEGWSEKSGNNLIFTKQELSGPSHIAWLRTKVVIPSSYKKLIDQTGALSLFAGRIYQNDETYFNGQLIGKTGSSDIKRYYLINPDLINWDKENTIAIRMRHWGDKTGSDISPPYIGVAKPSSVFEIRSLANGTEKKEPVNKKQVDYICNIVNHASKSVEGLVGAYFYDFSKRSIGKFNKTVKLEPGNNVVSFPFKSLSPFLKIHYTLTIPQYSYTAGWNDEYGYSNVTYKTADLVIADKAKAQFVSADLKEQVIKGWLGDRITDNEEKRLYQVDEAAILAGYINKPGDHPWIGEHVGKFLDAATNTYKNTGSAKLKTQMDRMAQQLIAAQLDNGYLGTYTPDNYWTSWDVWSHKYNIIGLLSYYSVSGFKPALESAKKAGDLLCKTFGYNKGQLDIVKSGGHVGMAATCVLEPMVDLYRYTGDKKYLDFCYYLTKSMEQSNGPKIISTLDATGRVDKTANAKAYEMLSNLLGLIKLYKVTGDTHFLEPVIKAWDDIETKRLYITGTASSFEHFKDDDELPATDKDNMGEGCVTTTWIQLNYQLLSLYGKVKYVNELERSVYNHLTGAENPQNGAVSYYTPLIGVKPYRSVITCCMSSVPRGIAMIPLFTNGKIDDIPSFLFYQPGTYTTYVQNKKLSFTTVTNFPSDGEISISVDADGPIQTPVEFRKPYWAEDFSITINSQKQPASNAELITINRPWKKGDKIAISFKMPVITLDGGHTYPGYVALQRGPQVLSFDNNVNGFASDKVSIDANNLSLQSNPGLLPANWLGGSAFQIKSTVNKTNKNITLVPYADASQTGGAITTWIKKSDSK